MEAGDPGGTLQLSHPALACQEYGKDCHFTDLPKDPHEVKIEDLENEIRALRARLEGLPTDVLSHQQQDVNGGAASSGRNSDSPAISSCFQRPKSTSFEAGSITLTDCVDASLITLEQAESYFAIFFQGCDHYVPIFDPQYNSLHSTRGRSSLLFSAICTVGFRIVNGTDSHQWRLLDFHLKRMLNCALARPEFACLETVQAFLVRSCYAPERSLLVAAATRMAVDLGFPESYDELVSQSADPRETNQNNETGAALMRKTRTWLHLLVLGHIHHVDAADLPTFKFIGDVRRSRIILKNAFATTLDLFLFCQVELNAARTRIHDSLSGLVSSDDDQLMKIVREARIDIDVWFDDWTHVFEKHSAQYPWLLVNLRMQKCWAENMVMCRAVRASGVENVDFMPPTQRTILVMAREALEEHLNIMIEEPRIYLRNLRFAMDFVWAKCAFCYLLLVKLSILLPHSLGRTSHELIEHGNILLAEMKEAAGRFLNGDRSNASKLYLQLLQTGIERFTNTVRDGYDAGMVDPAMSAGRPLSSFDAEERGGLESFVPEQFVFEWDFPGLTLFSSATGVAWLDDILLGALNAGDEVFGWGAMDMGG
ncbi:hypothetical protein PT974_07559 [Cladobotryum mycophilum]|uniref:Transcription factor domain-containing protein n=1 Tax=Cladobotryum mycophilum TaxID=491253 RepID=A0ABR0SPL5_9HYPO